MLASLLFVIALVLVALSTLAAWSVTQDARQGGGLDWLEATFLTTVTTVILVGWAATILGQLDSFDLRWMALILAGIAAIIAVVSHRKRTVGAPLFSFEKERWQEYLLLVLLAICAVIYFRPHEYVLGGSDAGTYMNVGAYVARTGGFVESSAWTKLLTEFSDTTLRHQPPSLRPSELQFVGWYIDGAANTLPQFLPFHPALLAVAIAMAGLQGGLLVVPLWGVLSIAAIYLFTRRLFGRNTALLAAALLAVTPTHIFFGRYPTAELLTLLLLFAGLLAFQVLWDDDGTPILWGIFGGAALGAAILTRIDLPLVVAIMLAALAWRLWERRWHSGWTAFVVTLGVAMLHLAIIVWQMNWPYFLNTYGAVIQYVDWGLLLAVGAALMLLAGGLWLFFRRRSLDQTDLPSAITTWLESTPVRWTLIFLVVGLSIFAYFLYPIVNPPSVATSWPGNNEFPVLNGQNWVRIGWYVTPLGLAAATFGLALILRREPLGRLSVFLLIGVLTTIQYVYNIFNTPYHIYAMRRYVPIVIPMLMIYAAYGIQALYWMRPKKVMRPASIAVGLILVLAMLYQGREIMQQRDFAGTAKQLSLLHEHIEPDAIIVIAEPPEGQFADALGVPLHFSFGHDIVTIRDEDGQVDELLETVMAAAASQERPVQLIATESIFKSVRENLRLEPVTMVSLSTDMLMNRYFDFPSVIQPIEYGIEIYHATEAGISTPSETTNFAEIDVGTLDAAFIGDGFYGKEVIPGAPTMRWTAEDAVVDLPAETSGPVTIDVEAMIYRPEGVPPTPVTVWLDGSQIGEFTPDQNWRTYSFDATERPENGFSTLEFRAVTFNPAALGLNEDTRELGFLIDEIVVREQ